MAGDWIKFELATLDKPEVITMADILETSTYDVVGRLLRVWGWFDQQTRNGNAVSVTGMTLKRFIDALVGSQGFAACMQKVGWLTDEGVPNFDRHNGKPAKDRALTKDRVKRIRNDCSVTNALPEKRREEKSNTERASRLPSDWSLPEDWRLWAQAQRPNWPTPFVNRVAEDFRDYWIAKAGRDACKTDWLATWRKWVRNTTDPKAAPVAADAPWKGAH